MFLDETETGSVLSPLESSPMASPRSPAEGQVRISFTRENSPDKIDGFQINKNFKETVPFL